MLPIPATRSRTITEKTLVYNLTGADLIDLLIERGMLTEAQRSNAQITFEVPGGGNWSNQTIDIDAENPITITVVDRKETTS